MNSVYLLWRIDITGMADVQRAVVGVFESEIAACRFAAKTIIKHVRELERDSRGYHRQNERLCLLMEREQYLEVVDEWNKFGIGWVRWNVRSHVVQT